MFGLFKNIFKKQESGGSAIAPASPAAPAYSRTATPGQPARSASNPFSGGDAKPAPATPAPPAVSAVAGKNGAATKTAQVPTGSKSAENKTPNAVTLPLDEIVPGLTHEFQSLFVPEKDAEVSFPLQSILPQLSTGRIRIPFGDLRSACPDGSCKAGPEHDSKLVDLPLAKVLSRVNPAFLPRKTQRAAMNVPSDVTGLFGDLGEPLGGAAPAARADTTAPAKPAAAVPPAATAPVEAPKPIAAPPVAKSTPPSIPKPNANRKPAISDADLGDIPSPFNFQKAAPAEEPAATATAPAPAPQVEPATVPGSERTLEDIPAIKFSLGGESPKPPVAQAQAAKAAPAPIAKPTPAVPVKPPAPVAAPAPAPAVQAAQDDNVIVLPVATVQDEWPDAVQAEIEQHGLAESHFALPYGEVDLAMRKGKIIFPWKTLRSWISPAGSAPKSSDCDDEELNLPLKMVAPLFLKQRQPRGAQRKISIEEEIPDLFSGGPDDEPKAAPVAPAPATAPKPAPAPEPATAPAAAAPVAHPAVPAKPAPMPKVSAANPAELVTRTAGMPGVTGALLAMSDGLMVASEMPKPLVGETVAAFLPQIFGRLTQFSTELKLGDLTSVMLVMDNSPWIIFRTGKVYFAVVGKAGEALPLPQLTAIVADIKRQNL